MTKRNRERIWSRYNGKCGYCGGSITLQTMQCDHIVPKSRLYGSPCTAKDYMPACAPCNHYKRAKCVESTGHHVGFREYMDKFHIRLGKLPKHTQVAKTLKRIEYMWVIANKYHITPDKPFSGKFWYEQQPTPDTGI